MGATAAAILVELDGDERRFCLSDQPRYRESVRVGLLEVIQRAVHEVLPHLLPGSDIPQVVRGARAVNRFNRYRVHCLGGGLAGSDLTDVVTHRAEKRLFEAAADMQQRRIPLPARVDPGESAVVKLVADVEGQLQIEAVRVGLTQRNVDRPGMQRRPAALKGVDHRGRKGTDGAGQFGFDGGRRQSHGAGNSPHRGGSNYFAAHSATSFCGSATMRAAMPVAQIRVRKTYSMRTRRLGRLWRLTLLAARGISRSSG